MSLNTVISNISNNNEELFKIHKRLDNLLQQLVDPGADNIIIPGLDPQQAVGLTQQLDNKVLENSGLVGNVQGQLTELENILIGAPITTTSPAANLGVPVAYPTQA